MGMQLKNQKIAEIRPVPPPGLKPLCVSVVIPVYNGATTIAKLVDHLVQSNPGYDLQIVLVNDASLDGSSAACAKLSALYSGIVLSVDLAKNVGEHNAVMAGLSFSTGDYCVIMDDDYQNDPDDAFQLVEKAKDENRDIVFSVYEDKKAAWWRNLGSYAVNRLAGKLMGLPSGLYLSSFKCLSRFAVDNVLHYKGPFPYVDGLALRATRNIGILETDHYPSMKSKSTYTLRKLIDLCFSMAVNFSVLPLRMSSLLGFVLSAAGILGAILVIKEKIENPALPVGWPSMAVSVLFLSGVQLMMLGMLGEYIGQLVLTINGTPQYVVRSVKGVKKDQDEP